MSIRFLLMLIICASAAYFLIGRTRRKHAVGSSATLMKLPSHSRSSFILCTFSMLAKLAESDGDISGEEIARVRSYIYETLNLDRKTSELALRVFSDATKSPLELRDYAEKFQKSFSEQVLVLNAAVEILVDLSLADGRLSPNEDELLRSAALLLGMSEPGYERIKKERLGTQSSVH